jgi:exodeoxyribonuclease VII large subunit
VAASRIPTIVAIGHEVDISLAELAADQRASTPSNAAQLLVPDKQHELRVLHDRRAGLAEALDSMVARLRTALTEERQRLSQVVESYFSDWRQSLHNERRILELLNPQRILRRGYALVKKGDVFVTDKVALQAGDQLKVLLHNRQLDATIQSVKGKK